jgi:predicted secreted Zn-dependent protease
MLAEPERNEYATAGIMVESDLLCQKKRRSVVLQLQDIHASR